MTDTTHECPKNGCNRRVPESQLACTKHWFEVSKSTRSWVWRAYEAGDAEDHALALNKAIGEMNRDRSGG